MKSSKSRYLVTTAEESTWPSKESPILFLGEWCRLYKRKEVWEKLDAELVPYHWDDRQKLDKDFHYLINLHETLLSELAQKLNEIHSVNYTVRYWRVLVGPWLGYFTQILFDRWSSLMQVEEHYDLNGTIILKGEEDSLVPNDMNTFISFFLEDKWNHHIYSLILQNSTEIECIEKERERIIEDRPGLQTHTNNPTLKYKFRKFISESLKLLQGNEDAFLITTYLPIVDEIRLYVRLNQFPQLRERVQPINFKVDNNQRKWILPSKNLSGFESLVRSIIPLQLPKIYLEGYSNLIVQTKSLNWPKRPKFIFTSNSHQWDDIFNAWAAQKVENGSPLFIGQHGGHYGTGNWSFAEQHELAISDAYLSWGWKNRNKQNVRPVGMLKRKWPMKVNHAAQTNILLVTNINPRQSYHLFSSTISRQWLDYLDEQFRFVESLPKSIVDVLIVRVNPQDWGWDQFQRWNDRFPKLRIDQAEFDIKASIRVCRIFVSTYNATTFLESLAMDVPTVIFWNTKHWELRASAIPYFEELKHIGVFHETPESAANHVAEVWNDVNEWWNRKKVKEVIGNFKKNYCDVNPHLINNLEKTFKGVLRSKSIGKKR